jgi:hypothetical protein
MARSRIPEFESSHPSQAVGLHEAFKMQSSYAAALAALVGVGYRTFTLPRTRRQVLGAALNCSEREISLEVSQVFMAGPHDE